MSKLSGKPIQVAKGATVTVVDNKVTVKGPKGTLVRDLAAGITVEIKEDTVTVGRASDEKKQQALHGLFRASIAWMIVGVTQGFSKELELVGVGYRAALQGKKLGLSLGFSHPVEVDPPAGITFAVQGTNKVTISGIDKQMVGEVAAKVRAIRSVEPYKGKGIRFSGEYVRKKAGKAAKAAAG